MLVYVILGSYFHILVGGYAFTYLIASLLLFGGSKHRVKYLKLLAIYIVCLIPFVIYLKSAVVNTVDHSPSADWIYSYYRHPHHIGLFKSLGYFYSKHFYGVLLSIFALIFSIYFFKVNTNEKLARLNHFILLSLAGVLIWVVIAYFDTEGILIKYYPFRVNTLTTLLLTLLVTHFLFTAIKQEFLSIFQFMIVCVSLIYLLKLGKPTLENMYAYLFEDTHTELIDACDYIKQNTPRDAVILSLKVTCH